MAAFFRRFRTNRKIQFDFLLSFGTLCNSTTNTQISDGTQSQTSFDLGGEAQKCLASVDVRPHFSFRTICSNIIIYERD